MGMLINGGLIHNINKAYNNKAIPKKNNRKTFGDIVTDDNISRMREIAYKDVVENRGEYSKEYKDFLSQLRASVAPDKKKLLAEARSQFNDEITKIKNERPDNLLEVFLEKEGKLKNGCGFYHADISSTGFVDMKIYDENGELAVRVCSSGKYHEFQTKPEQQCNKYFSSVYADAYKEFSGKISNKTNSNSSVSADLDAYV